MKNIILALFVCLISLPVFALGELGIGAIVGSQTGLSAKYWLGEKTAVDGAMAFALGRHSQFSMHSDYLFHSDGALVFQDTHPLDVFYGIGGRMQFSDDIQLGVRLPIGIAHRFENNRADMFGEVAPIVDFIGRTGLDLHLAIG